MNKSPNETANAEKAADVEERVWMKGRWRGHGGGGGGGGSVCVV